MKARVRLLLIMLFKAKEFLKLSPVDIYADRKGKIPFPSKEHIVPRKFLSKNAARDPHNIFVCTSLVNSLRGSLPFGVILPGDKTRQFIDGFTGLDVVRIPPDQSQICVRNKTHWMPPLHARGPIARTCLYMWWMYPEMTCHFNTSPELINEWSNLPVYEWEIIRNEKISENFRISPNPFIIS